MSTYRIPTLENIVRVVLGACYTHIPAHAHHLLTVYIHTPFENYLYISNLRVFTVYYMLMVPPVSSWLRVKAVRIRQWFHSHILARTYIFVVFHEKMIFL